MSYNDFMNKVRYWDNLVSKWLMRHIYFIFFEIILVLVFHQWFIYIFKVIDSVSQAQNGTLIERIIGIQSVYMALITLLMVLNSFWMLYMFGSVQRLRGLLKDMNYQIGKIRNNRTKTP